MTKTKVIAVVGPTASGKTALAIELAKRLGGEVISCDSMQIYRGMDIGTAKPSEAEKCGIPHHLIDIIEPSESFSAAEYAPLARAAIDDITSRGKIPIFCGGTGLYLDAVITANKYCEAETNESLRASLLAEAAAKGVDALWNRLNEVDPIEASNIHPNNVKRVARALEIYLTTGRPKSEWDAESRLEPSPYETTFFALDWERQTLYSRIDRRVDIMLEDGLVAEVKGLLDSGRLPRSSTAAQAIGYKELISYLDGERSLDESAAEIKQSSRRYAKRQLTWFRRNSAVNWLDIDDNYEVIVNNALKLLT